MEDNKTYYGEVIFFDSKKGYGFILWEIDGVKQKDIFLHFSDIECDGFKTVYKAQKVSFQIGVNKHGDPKAVFVKVV
jgi:CspA family cold shock protein